MTKKLKTYEVLVRALSNFSSVSLEVNVFNKKGENVFKKIKESSAEGCPVPYLSFIEENNEPFTLRSQLLYDDMDEYGEPTGEGKTIWDGIMEYSVDTSTWTVWDGTEINSSNDGKLYVRGTNNSVVHNDEVIGGFVLSENKHIQCVGNIENLLDYATVAAGNHPVMGDYCFETLFANNPSLISAPELPATTLTLGCYSAMFNCCSLTAAPALPATVLAESCYQAMFQGCESLVTPPEISATTLARRCCLKMFEECTSLTTAPNLPATTLATDCYNSMFEMCTSLVTAPELPATSLASDCYYRTLQGCDSLTGTIHCPASTASDPERLDAKANIPANTATVVYDL